MPRTSPLVGRQELGARALAEEIAVAHEHRDMKNTLMLP